MKRVYLAGLVVLVLCAASPAADQAQASEWMWSFTPYMWGSDLQMSVQINDQEVIDERVDLADLIDKLDFIISARLEGQRGKFGLFGDVYFADFGDDDKVYDLGPGQVVSKGDLEFTILELGGLYNPRGDGEGLALLVGARMFDFTLKIDAFYELDMGSTEGRNYDTSSTLWDALVGVRYLSSFGERWLFNFRADASAAGTDLTWTALAGVGWKYGSRRQHAILVGYRYMDIDFDEPTDRQQDIDAEIEMAGLYAAFKFGF